MSELSFIELNERAYKYIRQFTIKSAEDALIELITNCVDAYMKSDKTDNKTIEIEYVDGGYINVIDNAIGLTGNEMNDCLLQVGNYTNVDHSRGFFSRGAKDITAIGHVTFTGIKNGKYSVVYINSDAYGQVVINDEPVTDSIREKLKISENGMHVKLELLPNFDNFSPSNQAEDVSRLGVLRDIMADDTNNIHYSHLDAAGNILFRRKLQFTYPVGQPVLDLEYVVPNYPNVKAKFVVHKTTGKIEEPKKENQMMFGFAIKSDATIYDVNTIDDRFRWNPYINYLFGYVKCEYINTLLRKYDSEGSTDDNPMPIIDPSRNTGVNKEHPFIQSLLAIPKVRLDQVLRELNQSISQQSITLTEMDDLLNELSKYGLDIIDNEDIEVTFIPSYDSHLAKAIEDDRLNYISSEKSYLLTNNFDISSRATDSYIKEQIIKIGQVDDGDKFILDEDGSVLNIGNDSSINDEKENVDFLETLDDDIVSKLKSNPYIYSLSKEGDLMKLYIFEKGRIEYELSPEKETLKMKNKKFQISFINDINLDKRYIIEYSNGVHIKLNIHDPSIQKNLINSELMGLAVDLSIKHITSTKSLIFLRELVTEIFADVILENDVLNNKLILDSNNFNNTKKILSHRGSIITRIEVPIDLMFEKFIEINKDKKAEQINALIDVIGESLLPAVDFNTELGSKLYLLKTDLDQKLLALVE